MVGQCITDFGENTQQPLGRESETNTARERDGERQRETDRQTERERERDM